MIEEGIVNRMEAAFDRVGGHPVLDQLEKWTNSSRKSRRRKAAELSVILTEFVDNPTQMPETELKYLRNDVWELKVGKLRILFGGGKCSESVSQGVEKRSLTLPRTIQQATSSDVCGRATNSFHKNTDPTPRKEIDLAIGILREDKLR